VRTVIGEDELLFREGLALLLHEGGFNVVAQAADAGELLRKVQGHRPELVVTDVRMPPRNADDGLRAAIEIRRRFPGTAVVALSHHIVTEAAIELIGDRAEGVGYLLKERVADLDEFLSSIRRVAAGGSALDPEVVARLVGRGRDPLRELSPREREVLELMAQGRSNHGIGQALVISDDAVEKHVRSILSKLGIRIDVHDHRRVIAVLTYLRAAAGTSYRQP
jgi:DNA-binding NarL/FixJ family response regulator